MTAQWTSNCNDGLSSVGSYKNFDYTGTVQTFNACAGRYYKLEVWGGQGGLGSGGSGAGYGAYSFGQYLSSSNETLYVVVGASGTQGTCTTSLCLSGRYNGGGGAVGKESGGNTNGSGGGVTHIATKASTLSSL